MEIEVYMKKDIKSDALWENHPHLAFGLYLIVTNLFFFGGMFALIFANCPGWLLTIYLVGIWVVCIAVVLFRNEMCNISRSTAFLRVGQNLYMLKLGYLNEINYQAMGAPVDIVLGGVKTAHDLAVAEQVQLEEKDVRARRKKAESFACALSRILQGGPFPAGVTEYLKLEDARIEKETKGFIRISYQTPGGRKTKLFRNAYDIKPLFPVC